MIPLVTLCGSYNLTKEWVVPCIHSWKKLTNVNASDYNLIPDNRLDPLCAERFNQLGFNVHANDRYEQQITDALHKYPSLLAIREKDLTWRKLLDTTVLFAHYERILLIDTDVYVSQPTELPQLDADFMYMLEDIPAYRGHWSVIWNEPMVPALNAGMVIFKPGAVDLGFLEYLTKKYVLNCKDYWWSEQLAWACLAGRTKLRYVFDGKQTRVVSGFLKRSPKEVAENKFSFFGKRGVINDFEQFKPYIRDGLVLHFAGLGKRWFNQSKIYLDQKFNPNIINTLSIYQDQTLSFKEKTFISSRLMIKELI